MHLPECRIGTTGGMRCILLPSVQPGRDKAMPCLYGTGKSLNPELTPGQKRFQNQGKNTLSSIIGSYKSMVTRHVRDIHADFTWQSRFHDHIIRNDKSFYMIRQYINENPLKWFQNQLNPDNKDD